MLLSRPDEMAVLHYGTKFLLCMSFFMPIYTDGLFEKLSAIELHQKKTPNMTINVFFCIIQFVLSNGVEK